MTWRNYDSVDLEREYTPASRVNNIQIYLDEYERTGQDSRKSISHDKVKYGTDHDEWLWLAANSSATDTPDRDNKLVVFVHGGFWRRLSADDGTFLTPGWHKLGLSAASINYSLCPVASLETLVAQTSRAIDSLAQSYAPQHITLVGHSAGAHLLAMKLCSHGSPKFGAAIMVSGVFDLEPIVHTSVNTAVQLDEQTARALSPIHLVADAQNTPLAVIWGENETDEFKRQSQEFATAWSSVKTHSPAKQKEFASRNHFDILHELVAPEVFGLPTS